MGNVRRIYVEKKEPYAVKAKELHDELKNYLGIDVAKVREFIRYDVENISDEVFARACKTVFSEPPVDDLTDLPGGRDVELGARLLIGLFLKPLHPLAEPLRRLAERGDRDAGAGPLHQGEHGD